MFTMFDIIIAKPTWVTVNYGITATVRIKVKSIIIDDIFLRKPTYCWVIIPCPKICQPAQFIPHLAVISKTAGRSFLPYSLSKCTVFLTGFHLPVSIEDVSETSLFIRDVTVFLFLILPRKSHILH